MPDDSVEGFVQGPRVKMDAMFVGLGCLFLSVFLVFFSPSSSPFAPTPISSFQRISYMKDSMALQNGEPAVAD